MGLDDLVDDENNITNDEINNTTETSNQRRYVVITQEEFEKFLEEKVPYFWMPVNVDAGEIVYETEEFMFEYFDVSLRVFSTIDRGTGKTRDKGEDAIRTVIWNQEVNRPMGGRKKTLRIETWQKNLRGKIKSIADEWQNYIKPCPECNGWLVQRTGQYGEFMGCSNWSKEGDGCDYIERTEEPDEYVKDCPSCDDGFLVERSGPYGEFLGCINWVKDGTGCNYKEQINN